MSSLSSPDKSKIGTPLQGLSLNGHFCSEDRIADFCRLVASGINTKNTVGYHGTSLEAAQLLLETGRLPSLKKESLGYEGVICFIPLPSKLAELPSDCMLPKDNRDALDSVKSYAEQIARRTFLLRSLGFPENDVRSWVTAESLVLDADYHHERWFKKGELLPELRLGRPVVRNAVKEAREYQGGVVLALNAAIYDEFRVEPAVRDEGYKIFAADGIPMRCFEGISLLGEREKKFLRRITGGQNFKP